MDFQFEAITALLLEKEVEFSVNEKVLHKGLVNKYQIKDLGVTVTIKNRNIFIPLPYSYEWYEEDKEIYLDYRNEILFKKLNIPRDILRQVFGKLPEEQKHSNFYDSILLIKY